jgi:hypothetical protein
MRQPRCGPWLGGEAQSYMSYGNVGAHPSREVRSRATGHVATPEPTSAGRGGLELHDTLQRQSPPRQGGEVQSYKTHGSVWMHIMHDTDSGPRAHLGGRLRAHRWGQLFGGLRG